MRIIYTLGGDLYDIPKEVCPFIEDKVVMVGSCYCRNECPYCYGAKTVGSSESLNIMIPNKDDDKYPNIAKKKAIGIEQYNICCGGYVDCGKMYTELYLKYNLFINTTIR